MTLFSFLLTAGCSLSTMACLTLFQLGGLLQTSLTLFIDEGVTFMSLESIILELISLMKK